MKIAGSPVYLDTSALVKLYVQESDSESLEAALLGRTDLLVSDLCITEITSALARRVREGVAKATLANRLYRELLNDLKRQQFIQLALDPATHREAEKLLTTIGHRQALRSADALHLAQAILAGAGTFITYDTSLRAAARSVASIEVLPA